MQTSELNALKDKMHKEFVNRVPSDENTVKFLVGIGDNGVTKEKAALMVALAEKVAEASDNALVMFDCSFDGGVKVLKGGEQFYIEKACEKCAEELVSKYLA